MDQIRDIAVGWHADPNDPTTTRYWNGTRWTIQRRWSGIEWVDVPLAEPVAAAAASPAPPPAVVAPAALPGSGIAGGITAAVKATSTTFKVFVGAAFACVVGYFVPVTTITTDSGYTEARSLTDAGGFGVLILAAAAATLWFAWPTRQGGVVSKGALWGMGAMAAIVALLTIAVFAALGRATDDLGFATASRNVNPSIGLYLLLAGVVAQIVGICLAIRDRQRATA
jgi:hypothetical protein